MDADNRPAQQLDCIHGCTVSCIPLYPYREHACNHVNAALSRDLTLYLTSQLSTRSSGYTGSRDHIRNISYHCHVISCIIIMYILSKPNEIYRGDACNQQKGGTRHPHVPEMRFWNRPPHPGSKDRLPAPRMRCGPGTKTPALRCDLARNRSPGIKWASILRSGHCDLTSELEPRHGHRDVTSKPKPWHCDMGRASELRSKPEHCNGCCLETEGPALRCDLGTEAPA